MTQFDIKIGFKCNNNCIHCVVADKRPTRDMRVEEIIETLSSLDKGTEVQITGGEPTVYPEILLEVLRYCKSKDLIPIVQTNATGFADEDFCRKCAPYISDAHVAIHSCDPKVHDMIVGSKGGMWEKTIRGFKNLINNNVKITTQTVISKFNINTLYDTFKMIQDLRPGTIMSMTYPHMMGNAWSNRDIVCFRYHDHIDMIHKCLKQWGSMIFTESIPPCVMHPYKSYWSVENTLLYNLFNRVGVDISRDFNNFDYNKSDLQDRRKGPKCKECMYNDECVGVWKEYIDLFRYNLDLYPIKKECDNGD